MKGSSTQKCDALKDWKPHCNWTANCEKYYLRRLWITNVRRSRGSKCLKARIRFGVWPLSGKKPREKEGSFESHVSNKMYGWSSWHMGLTMSKYIISLLNLWESICLKLKKLKTHLEIICHNIHFRCGKGKSRTIKNIPEGWARCCRE